MKYSFAITATAVVAVAFSQGLAQAAMPSTQLGASIAVESIIQKTGNSYDDDERYEYHRSSPRRFTKQQYDRLPIRVTRPGNTGHYTFQDFPHWAELEATNLMAFRTAQLYDRGEGCGPMVNAAKYLAGKSTIDACNNALLTHGGMGYAKGYHVER